ncbi:DUF4232 domain-containing protein [Kitasatospora sp. NPDC036755]|uniref:DUF4232 domain-containing protein n=1 Tax=Kitasatospora sp. NPDC036755 TaxID=3154600 RepID=UPI0034036B23
MSARRAVPARRALFVPAALALGAALALTACGTDGGDAARPAQSAGSAAAAAPGATAPAGQPTVGAPSAPSAAPAGTGSARPRSSSAPTAPAAPGTGGGAAAGGDEAYAYSHPCEAEQLTVKVTARTEAPTQRVIEVRNQGTTSCGLSYHPLVSLGSAKAADRAKDLTPLLPGGLGGPPAYALAAGRTAYAVLDLNPGGGGSEVDQLNVLPDGDHMPAADTRNFPLGAGAKAGRPKLGLYGRDVAEAAASAATAGRG